MDQNPVNTSENPESSKKVSPLENLSNEELKKKCINLLGIAQKAKKAKDAFAEENKKLIDEVSKLETQKEADKNALMTMKEMVEAFTADKMKLSTELADLKVVNLKHENEIQSLTAISKSFEDISIENESLKRQINRLQEENEDLLRNLDDLEQKFKKVSAFGIEQQEALKILEEESIKWQEIEKNSKILQEEVEKLKVERDQLKHNCILDYSRQNVNINENEVRNKINELFNVMKNLQVDKSHMEILDTFNIPEIQENLDILLSSNNADEIQLKSNEVDDNKNSNEVNFYRKELLELLNCCEEVIEESLRSRNKLKEKRDNSTETITNYYSDKSTYTDDVGTKDNKYTETTDDLIDHSECNKNLEALNYEIQELNTKLSKRERENIELLEEMRELNEILKTRGDVISRQQEKINELTKEIVNKKGSSESNNDQNAQRDQRSKTVENLKAEDNGDHERSVVEESAPVRDSTETQSDVMSVSSICRAEESRIRDVEESLDEKYNKLRALAIKLKKRVQEQTVLIAKLEKEKAILENKENKEISASSEMNINTIQSHNKDLEEKINSLKTEIIDKDKSMELLNNKIQDLEKENRIKCNDSADSLQKELQNEIKVLKLEIEEFQKEIKQLKAENEKLKADVTSKENSISALNESKEKLKNELSKSKAIGKQTNLLSLEIDAYEKSLNTATQNLEAKTAQIKELEEKINSQDESITSLKKQISILEENLDSEKSHSLELKRQIDLQHTKIRESEHNRCSLKEQIQDLTKELENSKSKIDELNLELSDALGEKNSIRIAFEAEKEQFLRKIVSLEENVEVMTNKFKVSEDELESLKVDYAKYKVRAQTILKQNQSKETSKERELEEKVISLQSTIDTLNIKMENFQETVDKYEKKIDDLRYENEKIQKRCKELVDLLEKSRLQNESLISENQKQNFEYQESLKGHRLQIETLNNCYKKQVQDLETKHSNEIEELKKSFMTTNTERNTSRLGPFGASGNGFTNNNNINNSSKSIDEQKIDLLLMEREDAEGSETVAPNNNTLQQHGVHKHGQKSRSKHDLIPLEELLNSSSFEEDNQDERDTMKSSFHENVSTGGPELQIALEKLQIQESRVKHLTSLLAEAEQDLVKLTQMNKLLKEELRRHERAVEREQHIQNSEYLKNVFLKFLTLNSGDERMRLVPVLNTILKLSPEETQAVQNVAKGSSIESMQRSWGSYLPIWSNHQ